MDVPGFITGYVSERFGDDVGISSYKNQFIITAKNGAKNQELKKFSQAMHYLSSPQTWFHRETHSAEDSYERTLAGINMPLPVLDCQKTIYVYRPPDAVPLESFLPTDAKKLKDVYEMHKRLRDSFNAIDKALSGRKKLNYLRKIRGREGQDLTKYLEQPSLDTFLKPRYQPMKRPRQIDKRKIRFDMILGAEVPLPPEITFDDNEPTILMCFAEVKAFSSLANRELERRKQQLTAYDAWLSSKFPGSEPPLLLIEPCIVSSRELSMINGLKTHISRDVIPLTISTLDFITADMRRRINQAEAVEKGAKKHDMDPNVVNNFVEEHKHLLDFPGLGL